MLVYRPSTLEDAHLPAITVRRLFLVSKIYSVVEQVESSVCAVEVLLRSLDWEPDPVHQEQAEEYGHRKSEIELQQSGVVDIRSHGENHTNTGEHYGSLLDCIIVGATIETRMSKWTYATRTSLAKLANCHHNHVLVDGLS